MSVFNTGFPGAYKTKTLTSDLGKVWIENRARLKGKTPVKVANYDDVTISVIKMKQNEEEKLAWILIVNWI